MEEAKPEVKLQLQMVLPKERLGAPPAWSLPEGYTLRTFREGDEEGHVRVMQAAGFATWTRDQIPNWLLKCLPEGLFFIVHDASGVLVATAGASHNPLDHHPQGGEIGWVAGDPAHKGKGLGYAVCAAVIARFLAAGYTDIYLRTDDFRLPAIKTYLKLGLVPFLQAPDMEGRWKAVCQQLGVEYESIRVQRPE